MKSRRLCLNLLVDKIRGMYGSSLLVSYRTEYRHQWSGEPAFSELRLGGLGIESGEAMLAADYRQHAATRIGKATRL